ncbi:hypothetical protein B0H19DRAFT_432023 [Mycena capillaripes]|nr:hypothetical protein B0H19DRAFT_432023 [Mycena capillaripes]
MNTSSLLSPLLSGLDSILVRQTMDGNFPVLHTKPRITLYLGCKTLNTGPSSFVPPSLTSSLLKLGYSPYSRFGNRRCPIRAHTEPRIVVTVQRVDPSQCRLLEWVNRMQRAGSCREGACIVFYLQHYPLPFAFTSRSNHSYYLQSASYRLSPCPRFRPASYALTAPAASPYGRSAQYVRKTDFHAPSFRRNPSHDAATKPCGPGALVPHFISSSETASSKSSAAIKSSHFSISIPSAAIAVMHTVQARPAPQFGPVWVVTALLPPTIHRSLLDKMSPVQELVD